MFGIGGSELILILIVALIFLGPDKLPDAAKQISKGIRDLKKQSRILQETIENDEHIGGALRDIKSALRGDELPVRPRPKPVKKALPEGTVEAAKPETASAEPTIAPPNGEPARAEPTEAALEEAKPAVTLPPVAGEGDGAHPEPEELASLIKPAAGTIAKGHG
ncbi:MAG: twin-arginine translocase TatA/TatE family subunit [Acidobacteriota bacterium]